MSAQSLMPVSAVGKVAATPTLISRRAAVAPERGAITSNSDADRNEPMTTSVNGGWTG